jgi:ubiquinone/menaquinone biosynthesis C-methylase UbiE
MSAFRVSDKPDPVDRSRFFDQWSKTYDATLLQDLTYRPVHDALLDRVRGEPNRVLDLGCGTGQLTRRLAKRFPKSDVIGLDYSSGMLQQVGQTTQALVRGDAQSLPFGPSTFDMVTCVESFHWYPDQEQVVELLAEVLRPGGQVLLASISMLTRVGDKAVERLSTMSGQPIRARTASQVRQLLTSRGFSVVHQQRVPRLGLIPWPVLTDARLS